MLFLHTPLVLPFVLNVASRHRTNNNVLFFNTLHTGIVIQGESEAELPEQVLACGALKYPDVDIHSPLESFNF